MVPTIRILFGLAITFFALFSCGITREIQRVDPKPNPKLMPGESAIRIYWVGHATTLIRIGDKWILTDPIWKNHLWGTFWRYVEPGIDLGNLPKLDAILISHAHFDHMDNDTLSRLSKDTELFLPLGSPNYESYGFKKIHYVKEGFVWEKNQLRITSHPAKHFGGRWLIDNLWDGDPYTGYVIENKGKKIYFAGDTGYDENLFRSLAPKEMDVAILPMGPYRGLGGELGNAVHVNPKGAVRAFQDTKAKFMVPMHYGTFYTTPETEFPYVKDAIENSPLRERIRLLRQGDFADFP